MKFIAVNSKSSNNIKWSSKSDIYSYSGGSNLFLLKQILTWLDIRSMTNVEINFQRLTIKKLLFEWVGRSFSSGGRNSFSWIFIFTPTKIQFTARFCRTPISQLCEGLNSAARSGITADTLRHTAARIFGCQGRGLTRNDREKEKNSFITPIDRCARQSNPLQ